jgi:hypothetical protein
MSTRSVRNVNPRIAQMPKVVVAVNTPATKLSPAGSGDLRLSRLSYTTAVVTPTLRTLSESRNANPARGSSSAGMTSRTYG